ncbi:MAG: M4 family metallopeptidase [Verrucomicrobiota bacterium]
MRARPAERHRLRATATDACDSAVQVVCVPPSGSVFPIGETIVNCRASDAAGNFAECSFKVTVTPGQFMAPMLADVLPKVVALAGGTPLTVYGDNFTEDDEVWLDGQPLLFPVLINAQEIAGQAPALSTGAHELQIRRCGEIVARLSRASETRALPHLISVEPSQAFARGGNALLVRGTNFTAATRIRIGFPSADGISNLLRNASLSEDGASIIGEVPPLPADELLGPRDVIAEDDRGQDVLPRGLTYLPNPTETDPQVLSLRELQASSARPVEAEWRNGFPSGLLTRVRVTGATPEARARTFVRRFQDLLQVQNPDAELEVAGTQSEGLDDVKLRQNYEGVPVFGSEMVVTLEQDEVVAMTGNLLPIAEVKGRGLKGVPTLTSEQAVEAAKFQEGIQLPLDQLDPTAELMVYDQSLFAPTPLDSHLCWKIRINYADSELMVDAHSGEIVARLPLFRSHGFDLDIQDAEHEANAQSDKCFNTSTDTDVADEDDFDSDYDNDLDAVLANRFARDCWFYFHDVFGWHSYDNDQSQLEIFIHTTMNPANIAQWATGCDLIQFTDGGVDYDVMVHEFTHGIVASTSKLVYQFQSGALDESYADTMGVIADRERGEVENPGLPLNWIIGENLRGPLTPVGVRNFQDPTSPPPPRAAQPDRFANLCCAGVGTPNQANDFGGVHSNSGIPNKAGYLMIEGGSFQGFLVRGMGMDKTRHVKFWALRNLPANASFADARAREIAAAESFVSRQEHGFTALDVCTVRNAWAAVGVGVGDSNCDGKEDTLNDLDGDLIPNQLDNCPVTANPKQENNDRDRYGNVCDNCPDIPNDGQEDMDGDKIGDVCDKDRDGDGCLNEKDQDPNSNQHRIGSAVSPTCPDQSSALYGFAGGNSDCDPRVCLGLFEPLDCEDLDDDNDGIPDDQDPCPVGKLAKTIQGDCTVVGADCPRIPKGWWRTCLGGGCVQFYARVLDRINPNPFQDAIIDHVSIVNQTIYLQPNVGVSLAATAKQIAPVARVGLQANEPRLLRLEIWRRATDTEPPRLEAVVADFDPSALKLEQVELGSMLAFTPGVGTEPPTLGAVWHVGDFPVNASLDSDGDGIPDGWEINHGLNPRDPTDAAFDTDGDGLSDLEEYQLGTDMSSPTSRLAILFGLRQNGRFIVQFNGPTGRRCQLERTTGLGPASWSTVGTPVRLQGDTATLTDDAASAGQAVYRVRLLPD